jgi:hypothetical protein
MLLGGMDGGYDYLNAVYRSGQPQGWPLHRHLPIATGGISSAIAQ